MKMYVVLFDLDNGLYIERKVRSIVSAETPEEAQAYVIKYYLDYNNYKVFIKEVTEWDNNVMIITSSAPINKETCDFIS